MIARAVPFTVILPSELGVKVTPFIVVAAFAVFGIKFLPVTFTTTLPSSPTLTKLVGESGNGVPLCTVLPCNSLRNNPPLYELDKLILLPLTVPIWLAKLVFILLLDHVVDAPTALSLIPVLFSAMPSAVAAAVLALSVATFALFVACSQLATAITLLVAAFSAIPDALLICSILSSYSSMILVPTKKGENINGL